MIERKFCVENEMEEYHPWEFFSFRWISIGYKFFGQFWIDATSFLSKIEKKVNVNNGWIIV